MGAKRQPVGARAVTLQARYCPRGEGGEAWCERTAEGRFGVRGKYLAKRRRWGGVGGRRGGGG